MKLSQFPSGQSLQPLPAQVHADTSESIQRNATPQDIQDIQNAPQPELAPAPTYDSAAAPAPALDFSQSASYSSPLVPGILIAFAILIALGAVWLWRSFAE
jgi:hypothetical protein